MKKKKSNRGRKPNRATYSGIKPDQETWDEIRARIIWGSPDWAMVAVRHFSATDQRQEIAPFMRKLIVDCERAALDGDADWFRRQAKAIEKGGLPQRAQFNTKVVYLLEHAMCETLGRPKNWRPSTDAERKLFPNLTRVPQVVTLTPAGKFTDQTASDILKHLDAKRDKHARIIPDSDGKVTVERYKFVDVDSVMDAIRDLATLLQFKLKKQHL